MIFYLPPVGHLALESERKHRTWRWSSFGGNTSTSCYPWCDQVDIQTWRCRPKHPIPFLTSGTWPASLTWWLPAQAEVLASLKAAFPSQEKRSSFWGTSEILRKLVRQYWSVPKKLVRKRKIATATVRALSSNRCFPDFRFFLYNLILISKLNCRRYFIYSLLSTYSHHIIWSW